MRTALLILTAPVRFVWAVLRSAWYGILGRPVITPKPDRERRVALCSYCQHNKNGLCALCICDIEAKVLLSDQQCPDNPPRWLKIT